MKPCSYCGELKRYCWCGMHDEPGSKPIRYDIPIIDADFDEVPPRSMPVMLGDIRPSKSDEAEKR